MILSEHSLGLRALNERAHSLSCDGYRQFLQYFGSDVAMIKLVHTNGTRIELKYNVRANLLTQRTNGKIVYSSQVH